MAVFLGTWELGQNYGHIAKLMPVALALKARGHHMPLAAREPATARAAHGDPFAQIFRPPLYRPPSARQPTLTYAQVVADGGFADPPAMVELVRQWLTVFDRVAPAALIAEHAPASLLAAHVAGLPAAMIGSGFSVPPAERPLPSLMPWKQVSAEECAAADAAADAVVRAVCKAFGAPMLDGIAALLDRTRRYFTTLPELDPYGPRPGGTYYGPMAGFQAPRPAPWPVGNGPRAFVYVPFEHAAAPGLAVALADLGWPTVWHHPRPAAFDLPANIAHTLQPVDLIEALADSNLVVSRGGHATACEALMAGRPNIVLPDLLDTVLIGRRINLGRFGKATTASDAASLRALLEAVIADPDIAAALATARARYLNYRPDQAATQLADRLLADLLR